MNSPVNSRMPVSWRTIRSTITGDLRTPDEIREAVYLSTGDVQAKQSRFWLLLILAAGIATVGVISDSTATVIGAMIIAPLATPIQGVALGIAFGEVRPMMKSLATLVVAIVVTILFAALLATILPALEPASQNSQIIARVSPTILDLVAAAFTGLAGAIAVSRRDIADIVPGVAIAISLVPPLAVVGVSIQAGHWTDALGALLLFLTNVLAIILLGIVVFGVALAEHHGTRTVRMRKAYALVAAAAFVIVGALAFTTYHTVRLYDWQQRATTIGSGWAADNGNQLVSVRFEGSTLVLVVEGSASAAEDQRLLTLLHGAVPAGTPVTVDDVSGGIVHVGTVAAA